VEDVEAGQLQLVGGLRVLAEIEVDRMRYNKDIHTIVQALVAPWRLAAIREQEFPKPVPAIPRCKPVRIHRQQLIHRFINNGPL
jgi:hypothetical protein